MSKLTPKQSRFVEEYLIDLNISAAARRAGYSERSAASSGFQNMQHPQIQAQIQQAMQQRTHRTQVDQDYVLEVIRSTIERCRQAEAVTDRHGEPVYVADEQGELRPVYRFEATLVLKGAEMLGKHLGMFKDKTESHANDDARQMPTVIELVAPKAQTKDSESI